MDCERAVLLISLSSKSSTGFLVFAVLPHLLRAVGDFAPATVFSWDRQDSAALHSSSSKFTCSILRASWPRWVTRDLLATHVRPHLGALRI
ncbi:hypothetical protein V8C43DRAFT_282453 [Trichoderma afarasin]